MANPTMPELSESAAEALGGTVHAGTGVKHMAFNVGPDDTPSGFSRFMNTEENMLKQLAAAAAGLVVSLNSGLDVGAFGLNYQIGETAKSYAGNATYTLPASQTCRVYLDGDQTLKHDTSAWPSGDHIKLAVVVTDATSVISVSDRRWQNFQIGAISNWWTFKPSAECDLDGYGFNNLGRLAAKDWTELTIASGLITPTQLLHSVDTEGDGATDDLTDITAVAGAANRRFIILAAEDASRVVTVKSTGNLTLNDGDFVMDDLNKFIAFLQDSDTTWVEYSRNFHTVTQLAAALDVNGQALNNAGKLNLKPADVTISSGQITVTAGASYYRVDTEGMAASDDLDGITGGSTGDVIILEAKHTSRVVNVKDGVININLPSGADYVLENNKQLVLMFGAGGWTQSAPGAITLLDLIPSVKAIPYTIGPIYLAGSLSIKTYELKIHVPIPFTMKDATGSANTGPTGGPCIADILDDGASVFASQSEMINIADGTTQDTSATKNHSWAAGSIMTIELEAVNGAADLTIVINGYAGLQTPP